MSSIPENPKIYHITHWRNLTRIVRSGVLWSDAKRIELQVDCEVVGMSSIKKRRLEQLTVECHPGTRVGEYVPFYLCPRSIMLYMLYMANHPELTYRGGQQPIVHLVADLRATVEWAEENGRRWAISDRNAGAEYANFFARLDHLDKINWAAVEARDFRNLVIKDGKQAEFLVYETFPWNLIERIGVQNRRIEESVTSILEEARHRPPVAIEKLWYY